jgi:hypothetical protein
MMTNAEALAFLEARKTVIDDVTYPNGYEVRCLIDAFEDDGTVEDDVVLLNNTTINIKYEVHLEYECAGCSSVRSMMLNDAGILVDSGVHPRHYSWIVGYAVVSVAERNTGIGLALEDALNAIKILEGWNL